MDILYEMLWLQNVSAGEKHEYLDLIRILKTKYNFNVPGIAF